MTAGAAVHSLADEQHTRAESAAWSRFISAADDAEFHAAWLALLAARVQRARAALLLLCDADGSAFAVAAAWPDVQRDLQYLGPTAQRALTERRGVVEAADGQALNSEQGAHVGYPIELSGVLCGAVVVDIGGGSAPELQAALRELHWSIAWLMDHLRERSQQRERAEAGRMATLNALLAAALQHRRLRPHRWSRLRPASRRRPGSRRRRPGGQRRLWRPAWPSATDAPRLSTSWVPRRPATRMRRCG